MGLSNRRSAKHAKRSILDHLRGSFGYALFAVVACAFALSACGGSSGGSSGSDQGTNSGTTENAANSEDVPKGGLLRIGSPVLGDTNNPFTAINLASWATFTQIYPQLVQYDAKSHLVPDFAKSWKFSDGGRTLTFTTATNGKWSDGEPLTAEDAAWTISTIIKYVNGPAAGFEGGVKGIVSATAPNPETLVVKFKAPTATALSQLQTLWILPKHIWEQQVGNNGEGLRKFTNPAPVVSGGSFVLTKYEHESIELFEKNPYFYGPEPNIDGFGVQAFSNSAAILTALQNNEIDVALELEAVSAPELEKDPRFKVLQESNLLWAEIGFNSNEQNPSHPELRNPQVRLAFAHAINVPQMIELIEYGAATPTASQVAPGPFRNESLKQPAYDPAEANKILDELGYKRGSSGVRVADGRPMSYELLIPEGVGDAQRKAQMLVNYLKPVGIELKPVIADNASYFGTVTGPEGKYLDSDVFFDNWGNYPDPNFTLSLMTCEQRGSLNETGYCNPAYDKLFAEQAATIDQAKRKEIVFKMQEVLFEDHPYLPLYDEETTNGWSKSWGGYEPRVGGVLSNLSKQPLELVHQE